MIHHLTGRITLVQPTQLVLETGGVGFLLETPRGSFDEGAQGRTCTVYTHLEIGMNDGKVRLFGFAHERQREAFRLLLTVNAVGPQMAMNLLSGVTLDELRAAIEQDRPQLLEQIKGVGKKTAQRVVMELRDKVAALGAGTAAPAGGDSRLALVEDAVLALVGMGYTRASAEHCVKHAHSAANTPVSLEQLIKEALRVSR